MIRYYILALMQSIANKGFAVMIIPSKDAVGREVFCA